MTLDPAAIGGWVGMVIAGAFAAFERWRAEKKTQAATFSMREANEAKAIQSAHGEILQQKDELIRLARESAEQWKARCQAEHEEFAEYRKATHEKADKDNAAVLRATEEVAQLRARTDLSPLLNFIKEQGAINDKMLEALEQILKRLPKTVT